tara:strand:- start:523 stop:897 length:375 start_codon:yes stop_codon:yes gene_type:complete
MPLVKKELSLAAGATSEQILAGTTYEYVGPGTQIVVAAGAGDGAGGIAADDPTGVTMNFQVNNAEFTRDGAVSPLVSGEAFGYRGGYIMNDMVTTAVERNRPIITFTNTSGATRTISVAVFIGG